MNYKSKKSIFNSEIVNKEELSLDTKSRLRDSKYLIMILDVFMLCVNVFMLAYFIIKGFDIIALSILSVIIAMDVIHLVLSGFLNYKFLSNIIFTSVYSLVLLILTAALYTLSFFIFDGLTIFENVSIVISIVVRFVYFVVTLATMSLISKNRVKMIQPMIIIILAISLLAGSVFYGTMNGLYGKGSSLFDGNRTLEYRLNEADSVYNNEYYEVVGSLDSRYTNIMIPDEFNGKKVRAVDYSVFLTDGLKAVSFNSLESVHISNSEIGAAISADVKINMPKVMIDQFKQDIYNNVDGLNSNILGLADSVNPELAKGEIAVKFNFDSTNLPDDLLMEDEVSYNYMPTTYIQSSDEVTLQSIMESNEIYSDYYKNNYLSDNYEWNYTEKSKKAMRMDSSILDVTTEITENTTISVSFEDVYKIDYNFANATNDMFHEYAVDDLEVKTDKYIISSDLSDIELYEDIRFGSDVNWTVKSGTESASVSDATSIIDFVNSKSLDSDSAIVMQAHWKMYAPQDISLEINSDGAMTNNIIYGDNLDVKFMYPGDYSDTNDFGQLFSWSIKQGDNEIVSQSWTFDQQIKNNTVFTQKQATGIEYNAGIFNDNIVSKSLLNTTSSNEPIVISFTYTVKDKYYGDGEADGTLTLEQELNVAPKEVELEWKYDGAVIDDITDYRYNTATHTVSASIIDGICAYDKTGAGERVDVTASYISGEPYNKGNLIKYADEYSIDGQLIGNPNYAIKGENNANNTTKIVTIQPALVSVTYDINAADYTASGVNDISDINYLGKDYTITPIYMIKNQNGTPITLYDADGIITEKIGKIQLEQDQNVRNAGSYEIKFDCTTLERVTFSSSEQDPSGSYIFEKNMQFTNNYTFAIKQAVVEESDITWDASFEYSGAAQHYTGTFTLLGEDFGTDIEGNTVKTESAFTDAGEYSSRKLVIADGFDNYMLQEGLTKTIRMTKKVVTEFASETSTAEFNNNDYSKTVNATATGITGTSLKLEVVSATYAINSAKTGSVVSNFTNVGTYSNLIVKLSETDAENYSFTAFNEAVILKSDGYTNVIDSTLSFEITQYKLKANDLNIVKNKLYDANPEAKPTQITSNTFEQEIKYKVIIVSEDNIDISAGLNVGTVSYTIAVINDSAVTDNYDISDVDGSTLTYRIEKRNVVLNISDNDNIFYTAEQINFGYTLDVVGDACNTELLNNGFIDMNIVKAKAADTYTIVDKDIAAAFSRNYKLEKNVELIVKPAAIKELNITWGEVTGEYNGKLQGLTGSINNGLLGADVAFNITGITYKDVKFNSNGDVIPYTYTATEMKSGDFNYKIYDMETKKYTITQRSIDYTVPNTTDAFDNGTFTYTYSGNDNTPTLTKKDNAYGGTKEEFKINIRFSSDVVSDFTNATVNDSNRVEAKAITLSSGNPNFILNVTGDYKLIINKKEIKLDIADTVAYNAQVNYPKSMNHEDLLVYDTVDSINVGTGYNVTISLNTDSKSNYALMNTGYNVDKSSIDHKYSITPAELETSTIVYKATQISNIAEINESSFANMTALDQIKYNGKAWYIVARIAKDWGGNEQSAFVYTSASVDNFSKADYTADGYTVSVPVADITVYNNATSGFIAANYTFSADMTTTFNVSQYVVTSNDIQVLLDETLLDSTVNVYYNGLLRTVSAGFKPSFEGSVLIGMQTIDITSTLGNIEVINADSYTLTFTYGSDGNYLFGTDVSTYGFTLYKKEIVASTAGITWSDTTQVYNNTNKIFLGLVNVDGIPVDIKSDSTLFEAKLAGEYSTYEDTAFKLYTDGIENTNYTLTGVDQVFTITRAEINVDNIIWTGGGLSGPASNGLTVTYDYGNLPTIGATYTGFENENVELTVSPEAEGTIYNAYIGNTEQIYNFYAKSVNPNYYINNGSDENTGIEVKISKLDIADGSLLNWTLPGAETDITDGSHRVQYTGLEIKPTVTIGGKPLNLAINDSVDENYYINASTTAISVSIDTTQDNFTINVNREYSYIIIKQQIGIENVVFDGSVAGADKLTFVYNEGNSVITKAYVTINNEKVNLKVYDNNDSKIVNLDNPYKVTVSLESNSNYEVKSDEIDYYITYKEKSYVWSNTDTQAYANKTLTPSIDDVNVSYENFQVKIDGVYIKVINGTHLINADTYDLKYVASGSNDNYTYINDTSTFTILKSDIATYYDTAFVITEDEATYTGSPVKLPVLLVMDVPVVGALKFWQNGIEVKAPTNIGTYEVTIDCTGTEGNFTGTSIKTFRFKIK